MQKKLNAYLLKELDKILVGIGLTRRFTGDGPLTVAAQHLQLPCPCQMLHSMLQIVRDCDKRSCSRKAENCGNHPQQHNSQCRLSRFSGRLPRSLRSVARPVDFPPLCSKRPKISHTYSWPGVKREHTHVTWRPKLEKTMQRTQSLKSLIAPPSLSLSGSPLSEALHKKWCTTLTPDSTVQCKCSVSFTRQNCLPEVDLAASWRAEFRHNHHVQWILYVKTRAIASFRHRRWQNRKQTTNRPGRPGRQHSSSFVMWKL